MPNSTQDAESLAARLGAHPDYRVLRRLDVARERPRLTGLTVRRAAIVDTETTGTDASVDKVIELGGRVCPPTIVGVGIGGTSDLCMHLAKIAATRPLGTSCADPEGAAIEAELSEAVNELGIGPQGLGGWATAFRVHVEIAATHITMNPVAVNMQCHSARRARATFSTRGVEYGF